MGLDRFHARHVGAHTTDLHIQKRFVSKPLYFPDRGVLWFSLAIWFAGW